MEWRLAKSLEQLRSEVNAAYPQRSKASDGTKGDAAHASRPSRHNPNDAGVVCAIDLTHDPAHGCDIHALARRLVLRPHRDLEYVISNGQVAKRRNGFRWEPYTGTNRHDKHAHFAVGQGRDSEPTQPYDDTDPWGVTDVQPPTPTQETDDMVYIITPTRWLFLHAGKLVWVDKKIDAEVNAWDLREDPVTLKRIIDTFGPVVGVG